MEHYVVIAKSVNITEAGDEILEDKSILAVKHSAEEAIDVINAVKTAYTTDEFIAENGENHSMNGEIVITNSERDPSFNIYIYFEVISDEEY